MKAADDSNQIAGIQQGVGSLLDRAGTIGDGSSIRHSHSPWMGVVIPRSKRKSSARNVPHDEIAGKSLTFR